MLENYVFTIDKKNIKMNKKWDLIIIWVEI
jgi:hypothetical protein